MGCIVTRLPDCMEMQSEHEEIVTMSRSVQECYQEVLIPYKIRDFSPVKIFFPKSQNIHKRMSCSELVHKDFPVFSLSADDLVQVALEIFWDSGLDLSKAFGFFHCVSKNYYSSVPFHTFWHAFSVMQMIYVIGERNQKLIDFIEKNEYLYLLVAAIGHDICHPGINNGFLTACKHELALKYNDMSVLENLHAHVTIEIINASGLFGNELENNGKKIIIEAILATDMAKHRECCDNFNFTMQNFEKFNPVHRQKFMNYLLHCADLGNQTLDFSIAAMWSLKIVQEFNCQVFSEEAKGVKVSDFMRIGNDLTKIKNSQIGFITSIIHPLWIDLSEHVPNISDFHETVKKNKKKWQELTSFSNS